MQFLGGVFANYSSEDKLNESDVIASAESVDAFAAAISSVAPLDLMPGFKDPTGIMLPQKPFHYCKFYYIITFDYFMVKNIIKIWFFVLGLFPKAIEYKSFNRVSNPYECDIGGIS